MLYAICYMLYSVLMLYAILCRSTIVFRFDEDNRQVSSFVRPYRHCAVRVLDLPWIHHPHLDCLPPQPTLPS